MIERLTENREYKESEFTDPKMAAVMNRLREYENLGVTPKQIVEIDHLYTEKCKEMNKLYKRFDEFCENVAGGNTFGAMK